MIESYTSYFETQADGTTTRFYGPSGPTGATDKAKWRACQASVKCYVKKQEVTDGTSGFDSSDRPYFEFTTAPASGTVVDVVCVPIFTQTRNFPAENAFLPTQLEAGYDTDVYQAIYLRDCVAKGFGLLGVNDYTELTSKPKINGVELDGNVALSTLGIAAAEHTHDESDITGLVSDLAGKAASVHTHTESDITGLVSDLAGKITTPSGGSTGNVLKKTSDGVEWGTANGHSHDESDITGLVSDLAGKAASVHTHTESDITGLVSDLAGKITTPSGGSTGNVLKKTSDGVEWGTAKAVVEAALPSATGVLYMDSGTLTTASLTTESDYP